jgi:hypothetical protein
MINADLGLAGDQAFGFIGSSRFTGDAGQVRYAGSVVSGDVNGDGLADWQIKIANAPLLTEGDLLL